MATVTLILGRDGMGLNATEADFDSWVAYVSEHIDQACGFEVDVETRGKRDVQEDTIVAYGDEDARVAVREVKDRLWDDWCSEGAHARCTSGSRTDTTRYSGTCGR